MQNVFFEKCARRTRERAVCYWELKGGNENQLIDPNIVRYV
jgi:hypothetical protein